MIIDKKLTNLSLSLLKHSSATVSPVWTSKLVIHIHMMMMMIVMTMMMICMNSSKKYTSTYYEKTRKPPHL